MADSRPHLFMRTMVCPLNTEPPEALFHPVQYGEVARRARYVIRNLSVQHGLYLSHKGDGEANLNTPFYYEMAPLERLEFASEVPLIIYAAKPAAAAADTVNCSLLIVGLPRVNIATQALV